MSGPHCFSSRPAGAFNAAALADEMQGALEDGDFDEVLALVARGADVDTRDGMGNTALILAANFRREGVMARLLAAGADPGKLNHAGFSALHRVIERVSVTGAELLLRHGASFSPAQYKMTVMAGNRERIALVPAFVRAGAADVNETDFSGHTALMLTAIRGEKDTAAQLLDCGSSLEAKNSAGYTALALAVINGHAEMIELLAARGADLDAVNDCGDTLSKLAADFGKPDSAAALQRALAARAERAAAQDESRESAEQRTRRKMKIEALRSRAPRLTLKRHP